ncbi:MAG: MBL fold metallo-hydrolase, partial [Oscillospiraceae bacterium]
MAKRKSNDITKIIAAVAVLIAALIWLFDTFFSDKSGDNAYNAPVESISSQVTFVDVGQGDATLVVSGSEAMLIDTGERDSDNTLLKYLEEHNIDSLKYLVITHPHTDHMGEAAEVISEIPTDSIIMPKVTGKMIPTNSTYKNFLTTVKKLNKKITAAKDESFSLGNVQVMLFTSKEEHDNLNNYSVLVKVIDGENSFLITGDCEKEEEKEML